jgi:hypothetical protein
MNRIGQVTSLFKALPLLLGTGIEQIDEPYPEACGHCLERLKGRVSAAIFNQAHGRLLDLELGGQFILSPALVPAQPADISCQRLGDWGITRGKPLAESGPCHNAYGRRPTRVGPYDLSHI